MDIVLKQYWSIDYEIKKSIEEIEKELNIVFSQNSLDSLSLDRLELRLYQKL